MFKRLCLSVLAIGTVCSTPGFARENHAILIGASQYPNLAEEYWLVGPANDVDLVRNYLVQNTAVPFKPENITLLADGVEGATPPTLAAIRAAMSDLAARLERDDFVYLHFSGHGTQAPALNPDTELDGLDEVFLPVDIGPWSDTVGTITNALVDDEIGQMIAGLRASGADVWAVFDSCHSGTVTRAAPTGDDEVRLRKLSPEALGIPEDAILAAEDNARSRALPTDPRVQPPSPVDMVVTEAAQGGFVAFYAAQTNETTPEKRMPRGAENRRSQGVFTYTLFETLAARPGITYRQLGQEVLRRYSVNNLARSTPMFEGDLDAPVFSADAVDHARQWPLQIKDGRASVPAGRLHGLERGVRLAVLASPADPVEAALGFLDIDHADTFSADLTPVAAGALPAPELAALPRGAYARMTTEALDFALTVALPDPGTLPYEALQDAIAVAAKLQLFGPRIALVTAGKPADIRLATDSTGEHPDRLLVLPGTGMMETDVAARPLSIETDGKTPSELADDLADTFHAIARVQNLMRLGGAYGSDSLDVDVTLQTRSPDKPMLHDVAALPVPQMIPDDEVHILARNNESQPVDLNVLYIGSDYSIQHMFSGRLQPGDRLKQGLLRISDAAFGRDRIILLLSPAAKQSAIEDLSFLAQKELPTLRDIPDGQPPSFADALGQAGFGTVTRAATPLGGGSDSGPGPEILQIEINTRPRPE